MNDLAEQPKRTDEGLISVVMPCYNAEPYLREAVDCVLNQTYPNVELIVVEDGSTDGSAEILESYGDQIKVFHQDNEGPYPARNLGLAHAAGEYVAFLDADDWWQPDALEKLYSTLIACEADIAYCGWQNVGEVMQGEPYVPPEYEKEDIVDHFVRTCPWPIHAALITRQLVALVGGFSTRCYSSMDYDFWLGALATRPRIKRVPEVLAFYRWHGSTQVSAVKWRQVLDALTAQKEFIRDNPDMVSHLSRERLDELTEAQVLKQAYRAFWKRDLVSSQKLFRHAAAARVFRFQDLRHIVTALLPMSVYQWIVHNIDRRNGYA